MNNQKVMFQTQTIQQKVSSEDPGGIAKFCQQTSLHGWAYLESEPGLLRKFIWFIVVASSCCGSINFVVSNSKEYSRASTVTSIDSTTAPLSDITFPSVYVCNVNQVRKSFLDPLDINGNTEASSLLFQKFIDGFEANKTYTAADNATLAKLTNLTKAVYNWTEKEPFYRYSSQKCEDMIISLIWADTNSQRFYSAFQAITDYGACCLIIPYLDLINNETAAKESSTYSGDDFHSIPKGAKNGIQNGMTLVLDVESFDYAYFPRGSRGFRVALSNANDQAAIYQDGFYIASGTETLAAITPTILRTTNNTLERFEPSIRDCYLDSEFGFPNLKWSDGYRFSIKNCLYAAVLQRIINNCTCMPTFVRHNHFENLTFCVGEKLTCAIHWLDMMGNEPEPDMTYATNNMTQRLKCRQRCEFQSETMMTTTSSFPNTETFPFRAEFCLVLQKMAIICNNTARKKIFEEKYKQFTCASITERNNSLFVCNDKREANSTYVRINKQFTDFLFKYAEENLAVLYLFIKDPYYTLIKKDEQMTVISFIGNAGGLLGLCMGMSFVSMFEILYHCLNHILNRVLCCCNCLIRKGQ